MVTIKYRPVATRNGRLITLGKSKGTGRFRDGQIYYVPANSERAFPGYSSSFDMLMAELEFERKQHPDWNWRLQQATWDETNGLSRWVDVSDDVATSLIA